MKVREEDLRKELEIALAGKDSQSRCSARLGIRKDSFERLLRRARIHGVNAVLHSNMPRSYADSFKLEVVNSVINEPLSMEEAGARYNLRGSTIKSWVKKYQEGGEETLFLRTAEEDRGWEGRRSQGLRITSQGQWSI